MTDNPEPRRDDESNAIPGLDADELAQFDYLIDPLKGLPEIELPAEDIPTDDNLRIGRAPLPEDDFEADENTVIYRAASSDPVFGYLVAMAVSFGLIPLLPDGAPMRYTVAWGLLAVFGVVAWLLGNGEQIRQEPPDDLVWGVGIGVLAATPLYLFGGVTLGTTAEILFSSVPPGALLAYLVFVMPLGETLFFRGIVQHDRSVWFVGLLSTAWSALLFFPLIRNLDEFWAVTIFIGTILGIVNFVYSWVRERNGLAAAWLCQIVVNLMLIFLPYINQ